MTEEELIKLLSTDTGQDILIVIGSLTPDERTMLIASMVLVASEGDLKLSRERIYLSVAQIKNAR